MKFYLKVHQNVVDNFVRDILKTYRSRSPTIIFDEDAPEICWTQNWVLCLSNGPDKEGNEELEVFIGDAVPNHTNATHVFAKEGKTLGKCFK